MIPFPHLKASSFLDCCLAKIRKLIEQNGWLDKKTSVTLTIIYMPLLILATVQEKSLDTQGIILFVA